MTEKTQTVEVPAETLDTVESMLHELKGRRVEAGDEQNALAQYDEDIESDEVTDLEQAIQEVRQALR